MLLNSFQYTVRHMRKVIPVLYIESIQTLDYSRFTSRKPSAIVNEDELFDVNLENTAPPPQPKKEKKAKSQISKPKFDGTPKSKIQKDEQVSFEINEEKPSTQKRTIYTNLEESERLVSSIMMSIKSRKRRQKANKILLEGMRFIKDAMETKLIPEVIIFSRWEDITGTEFDKENTKLFKVPYRTIQLWSTLTTPPGVMGIFVKPEPIKISKSSLPITIICDNIRDPGNIGSILRAAAGAGCEKVILTKGCVDFWDTKVLRSAAGAHFRIPIFGNQEWNNINKLISSDAQVYVADNNSENNAAKYDETEVMEEMMAEEEEETEVDDEKPHLKKKKSEKKKYDLRVRYDNIPVVPYYSVEYARNEVILIVGGETEGLSQDSFKLVENRQGVRVNVPLTNGIDSLNAGMALGVITFEVQRQFLQIQKKLNQLEQ